MYITINTNGKTMEKYDAETQIKTACIIAMKKLLASISPAIGSSASTTDKSWLNLLTICPASVEEKKESGAFSTVSSNSLCVVKKGGKSGDLDKPL